MLVKEMYFVLVRCESTIYIFVAFLHFFESVIVVSSYVFRVSIYCISLEILNKPY